ncbi:MAG: aldo/keto reductase [Candidatus Eremiobacteraeota bacterium]|nr:aldo/keto reductase [Candidatus Eremiobacteraeota bacterium]
MEYRNLGRSGLLVSAVGLGCNNFGRRADLATSTAVVHKALEHGVNFFDTADVYGPEGVSEEYLGRALAKRRDDVLIATKLGAPMGDETFKRGASRRYIMSAVEASLTRLGTGHIDLYQVHLPDPATPIEETMRALDELVRQGKVRYIGHSNFAAWQVVECHYIAQMQHLHRFVSAQNQYSLLKREVETELLPACTAYGVGVLPYFPLASGFLTGKYQRDAPLPEGARLTNNQSAREQIMTPQNWNVLERLSDFARRREHTLAELSIAWLLSRPVVGSVIAGATKPEQIEANVKAAVWRLTREEVAEVDTLCS